ncbi:MAG: hypothetical protein AAGC68_04250 [Verrucomicrobiota bacterium]
MSGRRSSSNRRRRKSRPAPRHGLQAFLPDSALSAFTPSPETVVKTTKFFFGILLLPVCWILLETFLVLLQADTFAGNYWRTTEFLSFGAGCLIWLALFFSCRSRFMMWLYVAGHELTHALFVFLCRGRVSKVHISSEGGHILTNRNNFLISLSPYFFPFYTAIAIVVWAALQWVLRENGGLDPIWLYGTIGFTWMFHLSFTVWMILREQPDVDQNGRLFSFTVIFLVNMLLICALLVIASPTATFRGFGISLFENGRTFLTRLAESTVELIRALPF